MNHYCALNLTGLSTFLHGIDKINQSTCYLEPPPFFLWCVCVFNWGPLENIVLNPNKRAYPHVKIKARMAAMERY